MCYEPKTLAGASSSRPRVHTKIDGPARPASAPTQPATRTTKEWFDTLPSPYREQALQNTSYEKWHNRQKSLSDALLYGFTWENTAEGDKYWNALHDRALAGEFDIPEPEPVKGYSSLVPTTPLPAGFDRWEYRGEGWESGVTTTFTTYAGPVGGVGHWDENASHHPTAGFRSLHYWEAIPHEKPPVPAPAGTHWECRGVGFEGPAGPFYIRKLRTGGWSAVFGPHEPALGLPGSVYWEAVKDVVPADPVCPLPVPEGFSHWEYRGKGWHPKRVMPAYAVTTEREGVFVYRNSYPAAYPNRQYWEAIPEAPKPKVVGYRLLGPDDIITHGDEGLVEIGDRGDHPTWEPVSVSVGSKWNPIENYPTRRPITSYDDAR